MGLSFLRTTNRPGVCVLLAIVGVILLAGLRTQSWLRDPRVFLLVDDGPARWIRHPTPFSFYAVRRIEPIESTFRTEFELSQPVAAAQLKVQAFRKCRVWLDVDPASAQPLFSSSDDLDTWKQIHNIRLPEDLAAGKHVLSIQVTNERAHPCLLASSRELGVSTGANWESSPDRQNWQIAVAANDDLTEEISVKLKRRLYPDVYKSLQRLGPWLIVVFGLAFGWSMWESLSDPKLQSVSRWAVSAASLRWGLMIAWGVLGVNNIGRLHPGWGFDQKEHMEYVAFIAQHWRIPLATDGWQMFQSPLIYILAAPFYSVYSYLFDPDTRDKLLRIFPLLCGMAQIEINYRVARTVFPTRNDLQSISLIVGSLMPMNIYISQVFGNEPLAGCLTSLTILFCVQLLMAPEQQRDWRFFLAMGIVWGLALLSKVTPVVLTPLILIVVLCCGSSRFDSRLKQLVVVFGACGVTAGWYFLRNWWYLGRPFVGGWNQASGNSWWQDPSYRSWNQVTSFGRVLSQPIYSGLMSFWDAIYSSMWGDGFLSGVIVPLHENPWNLTWMEVGIFLSLLPLGCIVWGAISLWRRELTGCRYSLLFAVAAVGIYLGVELELFMTLPVYTTAKASYMLGVIPCFAILAAAGADPLLRSRWSRSAVVGVFACWAVASYATFFSLR